MRHDLRRNSPRDGETPAGAAVAVILCASALAAGSFTTLAIAPLAPLVRADLGLSRAQVGGLTAIVFLGAALSSSPAGRLTDRYGAPRLLVVALVAVGGAVGTFALAPNLVVILIAALSIGLAYGVITPPTNVIVRGSANPRSRGLMMSLKQTGVTVGGLIAGATLPTIAEATSWRTALFAPAALAALVAAVAFLLRRRLAAHDGSGVAAGIGEPSRPLALSRRWRVGTGAFGFLMAGMQLSLVTHLSVFLVEDHAWTLVTAGLAISLAMVTGTVGRLGWAILSDRVFPDRRDAGLRLNAYLGVIGFAILAAVEADGVVWATIAVLGACSIGWNGVFLTMISESVPPDQVGRASGIALRNVFFGVVVLPPALGAVADAAGWSVTWGVAAALTLLATAGLALATGEPRHAGATPG